MLIVLSLDSTSILLTRETLSKHRKVCCATSRPLDLTLSWEHHPQLNQQILVYLTSDFRYLKAVQKWREMIDSDFISSGSNFTEQKIYQDQCCCFLTRYHLDNLQYRVDPLLLSPVCWQSNDTVHSLLCTDIPLITNTSNHSKSISPDLLV